MKSTYCTNCKHKEGTQWYNVLCMRQPKTTISHFDATISRVHEYCAQKNKGECKDFEPSRSHLETSVRS